MGKQSRHSEQELLVLLRQGDINAFDELYEQYVKKMMAFALTFFPNKELAQDAVQDIFIRVWEKRKDLDDSKNFKTYLFQAVKFYMYNYIRDKKASCTFEEIPEDYLLVENKIEDDLTYEVLKESAFNLIDKLPKVQQEVFRLNKIEGLSSTEIATIMKLSKRTIEHHIYLASKTMKKEMLQHFTFTASLLFVIFYLG
ncbi:RNA polymerase sigma factor [Aquiflexum sp.]|uniref:RNA polymerase sigma factor n=1 Tax=Aquiflexum sp. TaxID=1872584 RepID=UPI00359458E0